MPKREATHPVLGIGPTDRVIIAISDVCQKKRATLHPAVGAGVPLQQKPDLRVQLVILEGPERTNIEDAVRAAGLQDESANARPRE